MLGQQAPQASFGKVWKIICRCPFCSQKHSVLDSLPRNTWKWCAVAHTKQWIIFVITLQQINFMPRGSCPNSPHNFPAMKSWCMAVMTQDVRPGEKHHAKVTSNLHCEQPSQLRGSRGMRTTLPWATQSYILSAQWDWVLVGWHRLSGDWHFQSWCSCSQDHDHKIDWVILPPGTAI